jgi:hypothetical protein
LADGIDYTYWLLESVGEEMPQSEKAGLTGLYERIKELLDADRIREIRSKTDEDARFGHKTAIGTFFGFKSHLAMTEERFIAGIEVTGGGENERARTVRFPNNAAWGNQKENAAILPRFVVNVKRIVKIMKPNPARSSISADGL